MSTIDSSSLISVVGANEHNLKDVNVDIFRNQVTVVTGVSGSGKSSLVFDTILAEAQRRFFFTLSHYSRQFLNFGSRPKVRKVSGLSPAISLQQYETQFSKNATVGTLTDMSELMGVLFARFGDQHCPNHQLPTTSMNAEDIEKKIISQFQNQTIAITIPIVEEKKGNFKTKFQSFIKKGYSNAYLNDTIVPISPPPELNKEEKHTIKIIIDQVKIKLEGSKRLSKSISTALQEGQGVIEVYPFAKNQLSMSACATFSTSGGCPKCGFSWGMIDARHFSSNSLGRCNHCNGKGGADEESKGEDFEVYTSCIPCQGTGISEQYQHIKVRRRSIHDVQNLTVRSIHEWLNQLQSQEKNPAHKRVVEELIAKAKGLLDVDLGYLQLSRRVTSLSGGEGQRLRLAGVLAEGLRGILYVLDEPSQGLHPTELQYIWKGIKKLQNQGNTILIVDHDEFIIKQADWIVDLGPGGGAQGGHITARFKPEEASSFAKLSITADFLSQKKKINASKISDQKKQFITLKNCNLNNLQIDSVNFLLNGLNIVSGVSGAGKTSLALHTLHKNIKHSLNNNKKTKKWLNCSDLQGAHVVESIALIDRKPIAKSSVSMPITYLDIFSDIRALYEKLPDAQIAGYKSKDFSMNVKGGRCEECKGRGEIVLSMRFLSDARVRCSVCDGKRYKADICEIRYNGLSISEVLDLTIKEAFEHFKNHKKVHRKLKPAMELGLGYLKLGQTSNSLSGGESQRLKLIPYLGKIWKEGSVIIMDEPTLGLHFSDVERLMVVLKELVKNNITLVLIEHNLDVILQSDWLIDLGPHSAELGGQLMYQGHPNDYPNIDTPTRSVLTH